MSTTATLEADYEIKEMAAPSYRPAETVWTRYFKMPRGSFDALKPALGATHSVNTGQIVQSVGQQGIAGSRNAVLMVVAYLETNASGMTG